MKKAVLPLAVVAAPIHPSNLSCSYFVTRIWPKRLIKLETLAVRQSITKFTSILASIKILFIAYTETKRSMRSLDIRRDYPPKTKTTFPVFHAVV